MRKSFLLAIFVMVATCSAAFAGTAVYTGSGDAVQFPPTWGDSATTVYTADDITFAGAPGSLQGVGLPTDNAEGIITDVPPSDFEFSMVITSAGAPGGIGIAIADASNPNWFLVLSLNNTLSVIRAVFGSELGRQEIGALPVTLRMTRTGDEVALEKMASDDADWVSVATADLAAQGADDWDLSFAVAKYYPSDTTSFTVDEIFLTGTSVPDVNSLAIVYVDKYNTSGTEDGTTWSTAFTTVQGGIDAAFADGGGEVWVAEGMYAEERTNDTGSVLMQADVHLYGGFAGDETTREQRDWETFITVIEGSTARGGEPAYHVVVGADNATLDGFIVTGGEARGTSVPERCGGGMSNPAVSPTVTNCTFLENVAEAWGGGMYNVLSAITVTNCVFAGNTAESAGGAVYNGNSGSPTVTDCVFEDNSAAGDGGAMANWHLGSSPTVINCVFQGNTVGNDGGAIHNRDASPTVTNCRFELNSAEESGGGLHLESSSATVTNCMFSANTTGYGGKGAGLNLDDATAIVRGCTFAGNLASSGGGGISLLRSTATVNNCAFSGNEGSFGGAIHNHTSSSVTASNCTFFQNSGRFQAGGITNRFCRSATITNCTFVDNRSDRAGAVWTGGTDRVSLTNCILWNNSPAEFILHESVSTFNVTYSDVRGGCDGEGNIDLDPLFAGEAYGDLRVSAASPCVDAGTSALAPETDLLGVARPLGAGVDMGAFEFPVGVDADGDTLPDVYEGVEDPDHDGIPNYLDLDSDEDGIPDAAEGIADVDADNVASYLDLDSDGNGILDADEGIEDADSDGAPDYLDLDNDGDGIGDAEEGTEDADGDGIPNHLDVESDGDGIPDADEGAGDADSDGVPNYLDVDSDDNGIPDIEEGTEDADSDGAPDYLDLDNDGDGIGDAEEGTEDADGDGIPNHLDLESDGDGIPDADEGQDDLDGDGTPNFLDLDSDGDGSPDSEDTLIVVFVDKDNVSAVQDGTSWDTAFSTIEEGIDGAPVSAGAVWVTEVWVAEGAYDEERTSDTGSVIMRENVHVFGGFAGTETDRSERDWETYVTVIDGSVSRGGSAAYHVIVGADYATLDGFVVTGGDASGTDYDACGGGMLNYNASSTVSNCVFAENSADHGGGFYGVLSVITVTDCTFTGNTAELEGGGMWIAGGCTSGPIVTGCTFAGNATDGEGGGVFSRGWPAMSDCRFLGNAARNGGGVHACNMLDWNCSFRGFIENCTFSGNTADQDGGGLYLNSPFSPIPEVVNLAPTHCTFTGNQADRGGGMYAAVEFGAWWPDVADCSFHGNSARVGGGMFNEGFELHDGEPWYGYSVTNCVFADNTAQDAGAGMYNLVLSPPITNCTFSGNAATVRGGAIANDESASPVVLNCILWDDLPEEITNLDETCEPFVTFSDIQGGYPGDGNIDLEPLFVDPAAGDFRLQPASPCIDTATSEGAPDTDIMSIPRPQGAEIDMGAYEFTAADSDGDTILDTYEGGYDPDRDGIPNYLDADSDDDGFSDGDEIARGSDPYDADSVPPFTRGGSCFIATAAYGTPAAREVGALCEFRDRYLLTNVAGTTFVRTYYRFSPPVARFVAAREPLRAAIRICLVPVVAIVRLTAWFPQTLTVIGLVTLGLSVWLFESRRRPDRVRQRARMG